MRSKVFFSSLFFLFFAFSLQAQDKIFMANGNIINGRVLRIGLETVVYKPWDDAWALRVNLSKSSVVKIIFEDDCEEVMANSGRENNRYSFFRNRDWDTTTSSDFRKRKILAISPLQFTEVGLGLSFSYERFLDKNGIISFILPVTSVFHTVKNENNDDYRQDYMYYVMPGLKFYPTPNTSSIRYAIGPSLVLGAGERTKYDYTYNYLSSLSPSERHNSSIVVGVIINNSFNFRPTKKMFLGLDFGLGFTYINRFGSANDGITTLVSGGFKVGYVF